MKLTTELQSIELICCSLGLTLKVRDVNLKLKMATRPRAITATKSTMSDVIWLINLAYNNAHVLEMLQHIRNAQASNAK